MRQTQVSIAASTSNGSESFSKDSSPATLLLQKKPICKYTKISQMQRNQLLHKVFFCQQKIKDAARELGINYSSAKTILHIHRKRFRFQNTKDIDPKKNVCTFKNINESIVKNSAASIEVVVSQGGKALSYQECPSQPLIPTFQLSRIALPSSSSQTQSQQNQLWAQQAKEINKPQNFHFPQSSDQSQKFQIANLKSTPQISTLSNQSGNPSNIPNTFPKFTHSTNQFSMNSIDFPTAALLTSPLSFFDMNQLQQLIMANQSTGDSKAAPPQLSLQDQLLLLSLLYPPQSLMNQLTLPSLSP